MDEITILGWAAIVLSSITSALNIGILLYLLTKGRHNISEKSMSLNSKEIDLLTRQFLFLEAKTENTLNRVDAIEKVLSAIIIAGPADDGSNGIMH